MSPPSRPFDWKRIWLGDLEPLFLLEICFRTVVIFAWTLLLLRLLGKRGVKQLSLFEVTIIIGLGSAVGDPMIHDDVPLTHAMVAIAVIVGLYRGFMFVVRKNERFQRFVEGSATCLVRDGRILDEAMKDERLASDDLFEVLRVHGIRHLGEVKRAYLERSGEISVFTMPETKQKEGLAIVPPPTPPGDEGERSADSELRACCRCGLVITKAEKDRRKTCPDCGHDRWGRASNDPIPDADAAQ